MSVIDEGYKIIHAHACLAALRWVLVIFAGISGAHWLLDGARTQREPADAPQNEKDADPGGGSASSVCHSP